jgi:AAA+ ATPase superfamily predicted ATPase
MSVLANRTLPIISDDPVTWVNSSFLRIITLRLVERRIEKSTDRQSEVANLNRLLTQSSAQFIAIYGSRRVGKTTLVLQSAQDSGLPYLYWVARRETTDAGRQDLARPSAYGLIPIRRIPKPPHFDSWEILFREMIHLLADEKTIVILDEFTTKC